MPGVTTLANARVGALRKVEAIFPRLSADQKTSAAGNTGATTAYINALGNYPDDFFEDTHWIVLPNGPLSSATGALEARLVIEFDSNDGLGNTLVTVREPFSAQVANGVTAYLSPIHPETLRSALNSAAVGLYPELFAYRQAHHIGGSRAWNGMWDYWDSDTVPLWWSKSNAAATVAKLTEPYYGQWGVTLTADAGGARYIYNTPDNPALLNELAGKDVVFHAMMRCTSSSVGGVSISDGAGDGSTVQHNGDSTWQEIVTATRSMVVGRPGAPIQFRIHAAAGGTVQIGPVWTTGGPDQLRIPLIPGRFKRGPVAVKQMAANWPTFVEEPSEIHGWHMESRSPSVNAAGTVSVGNEIVLDYAPTNEALMTFEGIDYLTEASSESDGYEIEGEHLEALYSRTLADISRSMANQPGGGATNLYLLFASDWDAIADNKLRETGFRMPRPVARHRPQLTSASSMSRHAHVRSVID